MTHVKCGYCRTFQDGHECRNCGAPVERTQTTSGDLNRALDELSMRLLPPDFAYQRVNDLYWQKQQFGNQQYLGLGNLPVRPTGSIISDFDQARRCLGIF